MAQEARGALYPSLTLSGSAGWTSQGVTLTSPAAFIATATASLLQPVLSGGRLRANRAVAEAQCEEALLAFRQSLLDAGEEVNDALAAWQSSARKAETDRRRVASLESAVRSAELLMQHSSASYLDVLVARQSLLSAELNLLTDRYQQIHGAISLYHALGGGRF